MDDTVVKELTDHVIRWTTNMLVEIVSNHVRRLPHKTCDHLREAIAHLAEAKRELWCAPETLHWKCLTCGSMLKHNSTHTNAAGDLCDTDSELVYVDAGQ